MNALKGTHRIFLALWIGAVLCPSVGAGDKPPSPQQQPFLRAMELEAFAANPFKWSLAHARRRDAESARIKSEEEAAAQARKRAFDSFMLEEWIAGDPADAIKVQRESMQNLLTTIESQRETIEQLRGEHKKTEQSVSDQIGEVKKALDEMRKQAELSAKTDEERAISLKKADDELKKGLEDLRGDLRGLGRRHQGEINLIRARTMNDFEAAEFDGMVFVRIPAGTFQRGTTPEQIGELSRREAWNRLNEAETPARRITISRPFLMSRFEVSQKMWKDVMDKNPSAFQGGEFPVESVSWNDIAEFLKRLAQRTGGAYRLPTEAEWEYCARAGSSGLFGAASGGEITFETIGEFAVMAENSENRTKPCGARKPNAWSLHDMNGNVWEWCQDVFQRDYYSRAPETAPLCDDDGTERVFRGGSWALETQYQRAAIRGGNLPDYRSQYVGFRLVREIED